MPQAHRDSPMRHSAVRIILGNLHEFFLGFLVPERVQQGDAALEGLLYRLGARNRKMHGPQLSLVEILVMIVFLAVVGEGSKSKEQRNRQQPRATSHDRTPLRRESSG